MNITKITPYPSNKIEYSLTKVKTLPLAYSIYLLTSYTGCIAYIGSTNNIRRRIYEHLVSSKFIKSTNSPVIYWVYFFKTSAKKFPQERGVINQFILNKGTHPYYNKIYPPT